MTRRSADIWTVRLLSSTMVPGQTAAMISSFETTSPARAISTPRMSSAREPTATRASAPSLSFARKQLPRTLHQLLLPVADHRRVNPKLRRQLRQGLLPRKRRHRHSRLKFRAALFPLDAHVSRPFGPVSL